MTLGGTSSKTVVPDDDGDDDYYRYVLKSLLKTIGNNRSESIKLKPTLQRVKRPTLN